MKRAFSTRPIRALVRTLERWWFSGTHLAFDLKRMSSNSHQFCWTNGVKALRFWISIRFLAFALLVSAAKAATYYVATNGSDSNPGTQAQPWITIQRAANTIAAGDTVNIAAGDYAEVVTITNIGSPSVVTRFIGVGHPTARALVVKGDWIYVEGIDFTKYQWNWRYLVQLIGTNITLSGCQIYEAGTNTGCVDFEGQACVLTNCIIQKPGYQMVYLSGASNSIVNSTLANSLGWDMCRVFGGWNKVSDCLFTNITEIAGTGNHADLFQTFGDKGLPSHDILIERNVAINCGSQFCQLEQKGVPDIRDWTFRNNVFINVSAAANCDLPGIWWYNNLFYRCTTNTAHPIGFSDGSSGRGAATRSGAKNNIFLECGIDPTNTGKGWYTAPTNLTDLDCDYNYVGGAGYAPKATGTERSRFRFVEPHGINGGDPSFGNVTAFDFRLLSNSLLIDKGTLISTFSDDMAGTTRPMGNAWDIGPYEWSGATPSRPETPRGLHTQP